METKHLQLAIRLTDLWAELPQVEAVALSGSLSSSHADTTSDLDLYVYTRGEISLAAREMLVARSGGATRASLGLDYWGSGDEWIDAASGIEVDIIYFEAQWMEDQILRVLRDHQPGLGYSTCLAHTVQNSQVFHDPQGWFAALQKISQQPYPEPLRQNIVRHNHPVLRQIIPSYFFQLEKALHRDDWVSVNHRLAGLFASYFDIIFAFNRQFHPGEKRMLEKAVASCPQLPDEMTADISAILKASGAPNTALLPRLSALLDRLDALLAREGF